MSDIIQLLPDNIANQIAAGEVIQRPASAVKELLENAVDAGSTEIKLIIQDAGKALVQVIDNGKGMSETDARMSFERHATSKIRKIEDLFLIRTMGFRGEALASIAAVSQVELRTKREEDELGTYIEIDNSVVHVQEPCSANNGTSIAMKNLFFNVPARRNFLKSNAAEMRHIVDEFIRVALSFPDIFFSLSANGQQIFHLEKANLKQRIIQLLGQQYNSKLVSVGEQTDYLNIRGFIGKADAVKKTRGDQYIFVNNRFIRSGYLNHAIMSAYQDLIPADAFPPYVLFIDIDPAHVDVNVHPTKQEIKFDDEKIIYAFVQAAVKHALAQYSVSPTLDFDLDPHVQHLDAISKPFTEEKQQHASSSPLFQSFTGKHQAHLIDKNKDQDSHLKNWQDFYTVPSKANADSPFKSLLEQVETSAIPNSVTRMEMNEDAALLQLQGIFIIAPTNRGFILVHQQLAHERILYERYAAAAAGQHIPTQTSLFPTTLELTPTDALLLQELLEDLTKLGYQLEPFGSNTFVIQGTPGDVESGNEKQTIENLIEQFKHFSSEVKFSKREKLIRTLTKQRSIKKGKYLTEKEMRSLITDLLNCRMPNVTIDGEPTYIEFKQDYLEKMFNQ
ncbi:MAG: DNA mismatch repair endonuclease MutL [Sphingobacteriales bacterium]